MKECFILRKCSTLWG